MSRPPCLLLGSSLFVAALCAAACAGTLATAAAPPPSPLEILVEDAASPWSNRDGSGYANDLVRAAFSSVGTAVKLSVVPYARCKALVMHGSAVACMNMSAAPELNGLVRFGDAPLFQVYPRFYDNADRPVQARSESEFRPGTRMGLVNGYEYPASTVEMRSRGVVMEVSDSDVTNLRKLDIGRLDVALIMTDDLRSETLIRRQAGVSKIRFVMQAQPQGSYIGFSAKHPEGDRVRALFNAGYRKISANGIKKSIDDTWRKRCADGCPR